MDQVLQLARCNLNHCLHSMSRSPYKNGIVRCNICKEGEGTEIVYHCIDCMFDLCHQCASLPRNLTHPGHDKHGKLSLEQLRPREVDTDLCNACQKSLPLCEGFLTAYKCGRCEFKLHPACSKAPEHDAKHSLELCFSNPDGLAIPCSLCAEFVDTKAWIYSGAEPGESLCLRCSLVSIRANSNKHSHPLHLKKEHEPWRCNVCSKFAGFEREKPWRYRCDHCNFDAHINCIVPTGTAFRTETAPSTTVQLQSILEKEMAEERKREHERQMADMQREHDMRMAALQRQLSMHYRQAESPPRRQSSIGKAFLLEWGKNVNKELGVWGNNLEVGVTNGIFDLSGLL